MTALSCASWSAAASLRSTTSMASLRPHQRQETPRRPPQGLRLLHHVLAREVEVPVLRRTTGPRDVEAGQVAAAGRTAHRRRERGGRWSARARRSPRSSVAPGRGAVSVVRAPRPRCRSPRLASSDMSTTAHRPTRERSRWEAQRSFDELGRPLRDLTFCVVDLETTGGSAEAGSMITEIGAVKVRGGEVLGEFQTLVNPHTEIPPFIAVLTGITNSMVADAPPIESALPRSWSSPRGMRPGRPQRAVRRRLPPALRRASRACPWPKFEVLDTAKLARRVITRDDAPNCKLSSLATHLPLHDDAQPPRPLRRPGHRRRPARPDRAARRPGRPHPRGAADLQRQGVSTAQRRKRHLAEGLPHAPGVYLFRDDRARVLYVGTSRDLRTRVRSYFTASETRSRMGEMVGLADSVTGIECATAARGRGARAAPDRRAQASLQPPLALPREGALPQAHPRDLAAALAGAPGARRRRRLPRPVLLAGRPPRSAWPPCTRRSRSGSARGRLPAARPARPASWPRWAGASPPATAASTPTTYAAVVRRLRDNLLQPPRRGRRARSPSGWPRWPTDERFEEAGIHRDRLAAFVRAAARTQRLTALTRCPSWSPPAARTTARWAVHVVRHGRLAAAGVIPPGADAHQFVAELRRQRARRSSRPRAGARRHRRGDREGSCAGSRRPGVRLIDVDGEWMCPVAGASRHLALHDAATQSRLSLVPFDDRRDLPSPSPAGSLECRP